MTEGKRKYGGVSRFFAMPFLLPCMSVYVLMVSLITKMGEKDGKNERNTIN
jgi:hypothetical protein